MPAPWASTFLTTPTSGSSSRSRFEQGIISKGVEPSDLPATLELGDGEFLPRIAHGQVRAQCPDCDGWTLMRKATVNHVCYTCWGNGETPVLRVVAWPSRQGGHRSSAAVARPRHINRNWKLGETLAELQAENRENGVPVP